MMIFFSDFKQRHTKILLQTTIYDISLRDPGEIDLCYLILITELISAAVRSTNSIE